jgi:transposase
MLRNHKLAKALSDESFGESRRQLTYKSVIYGTELHVADRWFPSSKKCSCCGKINEHLTLKDRVFKCECGLEIDRDFNAALNLVPRVTRESTPVDMEALVDAGIDVSTKLPWVKQEFQGAHNCALGK